jgi:sec-independent protein translocase protein TatA
LLYAQFVPGEVSKGRKIMGELSPLHWLVVLAVLMLFFGGKKIPELMKGLGEGVRSFKEGMREESAPQASAPAARTETPAALPAADKK